MVDDFAGRYLPTGPRAAGVRDLNDGDQHRRGILIGEKPDGL